jgi:UDP-2,3-diacylglucosamine pyrophosphatase LpxH
MTRSSLPPEANNYLLFSDVHLGADLVQHAQPWTSERLREAHQVDHQLGSMLEYYRARSEPGRPWRLVIAGDFIDLVGMSISADPSLAAALSEDDREHGLGSSHEHAAIKMRAVAARHHGLFQKLARFIDAGHALVLIRGNHDVELYWEAAQTAFVEALLARSELPKDDAANRALFEQRIEFRHWFYYVRGLLYVEHGHQYDPTCAYQHVLAPLSPRDPFRISYSFSDILLRYVVRPTRQLSQDGHENNSMLWYLRLAFSLGLRGCAQLGYRFFGAVRRMVTAWRDHLSEHAAKVREEHEKRLHQLGVMLRLKPDLLQKMTQLWATPVTARLATIFRTVFLDGLAVGLLSALVIALLGVAGVVSWMYLPLFFALVSAGMFFYATQAKVLEPHSALRSGAAKLAELMPARYYVMGHTHRPVMEPVSATSTYVNLGNWSVDLLDEHAPKAPCSHLVIRHDERTGRHTATLYGWDCAEGASVMWSDVERAPEALSGAAVLSPGALQTQPVSPRS